MVAAELERTLHKDPVAHAKMTEYLSPSVDSKTMVAGQKTDITKQQSTRTYFKELYLYLYIKQNLSCALICDLIAVGSYDAQKIKYINVLTLAHASFFFYSKKYTQLVLQYICVK